MSRFLVGISLTAATLALCLGLQRVLGSAPRSFVTIFFVMSMAAAWFGGLRNGLLCVGLGAFALVTVLAEPRFKIGIQSPNDQAALLAFLVTSLVGNWVLAVARADQQSTLTPTVPNSRWLGCFVLASLTAGGLGQGLKLIPAVEITFWPPSGIFVAALLLNHPRTWPWWVAGACLAELVGNVVWYHYPLDLALLYFGANAAEALTAAMLVRAAVGKGTTVIHPRQLESPLNAILFALLAGGLAPCVGATIIATADAILGKHDFGTAWQLVWLGDGTGLLLSAPWTMAAVRIWRRGRRLSVQPAVEFAATCGLIVFLTWLALREDLPTVYLALPAIMWAAIRFQVWGAWAVVAAVFLTVATFTRLGIGEFAGDPEQMRQRLIAMQVFLGICTSSALIVAGVSALLVQTQRRLRAANLSLERRILERTAELRESEERFRLSLQGSNVIIAQCDPELRYVWIHGSHRDFETREVIGKRDTEIADNEGTRLLEQLKKTVRDTRAEATCEITFPLADGLRTYAVRAEPRFKTSGELDAIVTVGVDVSNRQRTEQALRQSESLFRTLAATAPVGIFRTDAAGKCLFVNEWWVKTTGMSVDQALGGGWTAALHPDDRPKVVERWNHAIQRQEFYCDEYRFIHPSGDITWVVGRAVPEFGTQGIVGYVGTLSDITERKLAEERLRTSEEQFRLAMDAAQAGSWKVNLSTGEFMASDLALSLHGLPPGTVMTHELALACVHHEDRVFVEEALQRSVRTGESLRLEHRVCRRDGSMKWVASFADVRSDQGQTWLMGLVQDITVRKQVEQALCDSEKSLAALIEQSPFGIYIVDAEFRIIQINQRSEEGAFMNVRPVIGRSFDEAMRIIWPEPVATDCINIFRHTLVTGEPYYSKDFMYARADVAQTECYEWQTHRITLPNGGHGVVCYYFDATKLRQAEWKLKESDRQKDEFLATLAHELRNPLAPIRNGLHIMKLAAGDASTVESCRSMMERQIMQMTRLIDDLMDVSRISQGKLVLQKSRLALTDAVRNAVDISRPLIEAQGHELVVDIPAEPIHVEGDLTRLSQVLANLLNNAAKYTDNGGRIRLTVAIHGREVAVSVADNGSGIPPSMLDRVFELFTQVDRSLEKSQGGLGIGLNIVKRLVEKHGGNITAESGGLGCGSKFIVRLPVLGALPVDSSADHDDTQSRSTICRRIIVADDNPDSANTLAMMLTMMGNEARVTQDGLQAVEMAKAFRPDVILMDIGMPKLNGYDACRRIRSEEWGKRIVMIACTGWGQDEDRRLSQEAGFDHHLVKPVDPDALRQVFDEMRVEKAGLCSTAVSPGIAQKNGGELSHSSPHDA